MVNGRKCSCELKTVATEEEQVRNPLFLKQSLIPADSPRSKPTCDAGCEAVGFVILFQANSLNYFLLISFSDLFLGEMDLLLNLWICSEWAAYSCA